MLHLLAGITLARLRLRLRLGFGLGLGLGLGWKEEGVGLRVRLSVSQSVAGQSLCVPYQVATHPAHSSHTTHTPCTPRTPHTHTPAGLACARGEMAENMARDLNKLQKSFSQHPSHSLPFSTTPYPLSFFFGRRSCSLAFVARQTAAFM